MITLRNGEKTDPGQVLMGFLKQNMNCYSCQLLKICAPEDIPLEILEILQKTIQQDQTLSKNQVLLRSEDNLDYLYVLRSGALKAWHVDETGHERILDFYLPGELIGLEAIANKRYPLHLTALEKSVFCRMHYAQLSHIIQKQPQLQGHLLMLASNKLSAYNSLSHMDAETRLIEFLHRLCQRLRKQDSTFFRLCMSRVDLANYLNLAPETVSRLFARLEKNGVLSVRGRRVEINSLKNH